MDLDQFKRDYFFILCYFEDKNQKIAALNLWCNGFLIFKEAKCVKEFSLLMKLLKSFSTTTSNIEQIAPFAFETIMDLTRIITCFENFIKGALLIQGIVVHECTDSIKRKIQNERPIYRDDVFKPNSFIGLNRKKSFEVSYKTLPFSKLISASYNEVVHLPKGIIEILSEYNILRNRLHFITHNEISSDLYSNEKLLNLISFVDNIILPRFNDLNKYLETLKGNI